MQTFAGESNTYYMTNSLDKILFHVSSRDVSGTNSSKKLRKEGKVVGNIYGLNKESINIHMDENSIRKLYSSQGDTGLIYLQIEDNKKQIPVLISEYQTDVFGKIILHVSFKRVDLESVIRVEVPVELMGESTVPESIVSLVKDTVEVESLPADLPERFEIDVSKFTKVGQSVNLSELSFDKNKVTFVLNEDEKPEDISLVIVQAIAGEVEEKETPETQVGEEDSSEEGDEKSESTSKDKPAESKEKSEEKTE